MRQELLDTLKVNAETLEQVWPKKEPLTQVKWSVQLPVDHALSYRPSAICSRDRIVVYTLKDGVPLFFQQDDGPLFPTLHLLQKCE